MLIELQCLECGKMHTFEEESLEARQILNVFCDE